MMYNTAQNYRSLTAYNNSLARKIVGAIFLSIFVTITILLYLLAIPAWQIRLHGVQATALARANGMCSNDDDSSSGESYSFAYTFTGPQGKPYRVAQEGFCTNVIKDGDQVTIWYMPDTPTTLLSTPEVILLYIFSALGGGMDLVCLVILLLTLRGSIRARRRLEMFNYANPDWQ